MKVLVTGATGFVGAELTQALVRQEVGVRILRRASSSLDLLGEVAGRVEQAIGDVTEPESLRAAMKGVEEVYHVAGYIGYGSNREHAQLHRINVEGTAHVVNAALAAGVRRLVHTSSMAAFGRTPQTDGLIDETAVWQPSRVNTAYAHAKYRGELEVHRGIAEGLDAVIVNPALIFGVGRADENTRQIVEKVRNRKLPAIPAGGTNVVDVKDVADGHVRAMQHGRTGERYFLGGENLSWRAIIQTLADAFGVAPPRLVAPPVLALGVASLSELLAAVTRTRPLINRETVRLASRTYRYSNRKAVEELGCTFRPFAETAQRVAAALEGKGDDVKEAQRHGLRRRAGPGIRR